MANSAGNVPKGNEGQTDMDRGSSYIGTVTKGQRNTGRVGGLDKTGNSNTADGNKVRANDPRLSK